MIVKFRNFNTLALAASAAAASIALGAIGLSQWNRATAEQQAQSSTPGPVVRSGVTALGRLEPESEVVRLAAPLALDGDRVSELRVREGDQVRAGQVVALLASETVLVAEYNEANRQVQVAEARLAQVRAE